MNGIEEPPGRVPGDLATMDDEGLAGHICSFASRISAATCVFLLAIAEYDRRRAWEAWECRSMVEWLSWRCRTSRVTAAQYCRTAAALVRLPVVRERFAAGALSYSQVRALVKVATPANETVLADWAACMTANQLERVTSTYQRTRAAAEETARERNRRRTLDWHYEEDGSVTGVFRLPPEQAAVLMRAIGERAVPIDPTVPDSGDEAQVVDPLGARRADALVEMAGDDLDRQVGDEADPGDRYLVTIVAEEAVVTGAEPCSDQESGSEIIEARIVEEPPAESAPTDVGPPSRLEMPVEVPVEGGDGRGDVRPPGPLHGVRCQVLDGPGLAPSTVELLLCDQPTVKVKVNGRGDVLDVGRRTRRISRPLRRALASAG